MTMVIFIGFVFMATQQKRREKTRAKIIDATRKLIEKQSFDEISVNQIVQQADVAKGTFYQYYDTKVDVLLDLTRDDGVEKLATAMHAIKAGAPIIPFLESYIQGMCDWFENHENYAEAIVISSFKSIGLEESNDPQRYNRAFLAELMKHGQAQGVFRDDIDAGELAKVIGAALIASVLGWTKNPVKGALGKSMQESLKIFLDGSRIERKKS